MRLHDLLALPVFLARRDWDHRCHYDQCAQQVQHEKLGQCSALFRATTGPASVKTSHITSTTTIYQTDTTVVVAPTTSTITASTTQTATASSTTIVSVTQTIPSTTIITVDSTEIVSITDVETITAQVTETDTVTNFVTVVTTVPAAARKRDATSKSTPTLVNPHFALMTPNTPISNGIAARAVVCPKKCPNTAAFYSACQCLGFKTKTIPGPLSTTTATSVVTTTVHTTTTTLSASTAYVTNTLTFTSTVTNTATITSTITTQSPVTQLVTSLETDTTVIDLMAVATNVNTDFVTVVQTTTVAEICTPTGYRFQVASPASKAGIWLNDDYKMEFGNTDISSAAIFTIDTSDNNELHAPGGLEADYDHNYTPSPFWFDTTSNVNAQVAAGTWSKIGCTVSENGPAPWPVSCQSGDKNLFISDGSNIYFYQSVSSGYFQLQVVAYPAC